MIFKEKLDGNFNKSDIAKKIGKTVPTGHRWEKSRGACTRVLRTEE